MLFLDRARLSEALGAGLPPSITGVSGVTHDSRRVRPGFAFVAIPGFKRNGAEFVPAALKAGASLIVAERAVPDVPTAVVPDARNALAALAVALYDDPSAKLNVHGVTGTNGKTTTSYALHGILAGAHGPERCGLMSTAEVITGNERRPAIHTTPEATVVQGALRKMLDSGVKHTVMEVSSHGVALRRVTGTHFSGALFTNLTRDHLDLHGSMEEYYAAKRELFRWAAGPKLSNADDAHGRRLASEVEGVSTFGAAADADYRVEGVRPASGGTVFSLRHPAGVVGVESPLLGPYNVENVAGAAALALALGVEEGVVVRAARGMAQVPGRFERALAVDALGFEVVVDYAHTDVGLEAVLKVARGVAGGGRVICVFGAAGERDGAKRPLMGRVAARLADFSVVTTDDAYGEDPGKISHEIVAGAGGGPGRYEVILDRRAAIRRALEEAGPGDVVVVAGKGHERVQHLPEGDVSFHDATVVRELAREFAERKGG